MPIWSPLTLKSKLYQKANWTTNLDYSSPVLWSSPGRTMSYIRTKYWAQILHFHFSLSCIWEGNGNPLQCSCLENPRDGGAWWAAIYGVAQSRHDWSDLAAAAAVYIWELPRWLSGKNPPATARDAGNLGSTPESGRSPGEGNGNPLQYSCLENSLAEEPVRLHGVTKNWTRLSY